MSTETLSFQAEVSKLLDIVAHSLYSHKEIFLRELISNASDACDKLRYAALTKPELLEGDANFRIEITSDGKQTLSIADNGVGMNRQDLIDNLGTIARSGTAAYLEQMTAANKSKTSKDKDTAGKAAPAQLIGQFGVGFYSSFMVAEQVSVVSRRAGDTQAWRWTSDGKGEFTLEQAERAGHGTTVTLTLNQADTEYADPSRIRHIVTTYSDHIAIPVVLLKEAQGDDADQDDADQDDADQSEETLNQASAIWTRAKSDISEEQYKEFYHHVAHAFDEPWMTLHNQVEGVVTYSNLLYVPSSRPFDLFAPERKQQIKLYVKKVFITDDCSELMPAYLRFLRGIVDVVDLPLNISREMLQHNPVLAKIRSGLVKRVLGELQKKADKDPSAYLEFWEAFGNVLKEGIYEDFDNRDKLVALARFRSTASDGWVSLADYLGRMKEGQQEIFYLSGDSLSVLRNSPHLEAFRAKGVEVLLMTDPVDEFWLPAVGKHEEKAFKSVSRGGADLSAIKGNSPEVEDGTSDAASDEGSSTTDESADGHQRSDLIDAFKTALGETVKGVRTSGRLTDSPVCLVADDNDFDMQFEKLLRKSGQLTDSLPRILEINTKHPLMDKLDKLAKNDRDGFADAAKLLLDQARIIEGERVDDPTAFARRMTAVLEKGFS